MIIVIACCMLIRTEIPSCCLMLLSLRSLYPFTTNFSFSACKQHKTFSQNDISIFILYMLIEIYDLFEISHSISKSCFKYQFIFHCMPPWMFIIPKFTGNEAHLFCVVALHICIITWYWKKQEMFCGARVYNLYSNEIVLNDQDPGGPHFFPFTMQRHLPSRSNKCCR